MSKVIIGIVLFIGIIVAGLFIDQYWSSEQDKIHLVLVGILIGAVISGIGVIGILIARSRGIIQ